MTHGKTYNKPPGGGGEGVKALLQLANFTLGPDATLNTEIHKIRYYWNLIIYIYNLNKFDRHSPMEHLYIFFLIGP